MKADKYAVKINEPKKKYDRKKENKSKEMMHISFINTAA